MYGSGHFNGGVWEETVGGRKLGVMVSEREGKKPISAGFQFVKK